MLSEVQRLLKMTPVSDGDIDVGYAALRFLDLLVMLGPEEFLIMQVSEYVCVCVCVCVLFCGSWICL